MATVLHATRKNQIVSSLPSSDSDIPQYHRNGLGFGIKPYFQVTAAVEATLSSILAQLHCNFFSEKCESKNKYPFQDKLKDTRDWYNQTKNQSMKFYKE